MLRITSLKQLIQQYNKFSSSVDHERPMQGLDKSAHLYTVTI